MKTKKGIFKKIVALSLLLNLALSPTAMVIGNTIYAENTNTSDKAELPAFCLAGIDKTTGKRIAKQITLKVKTHPDYAFWGEDEYLIESINGVFDFSVVEDKGNLYTIEIEGESDYQLSNIKKDNKNLYILKFDEIKKIMRTSNMNGDEVELSNLILEKKSNNEEEPEVENKEVTIQDIDVVFEDGTAVPDGINFHTFNKENKDMFDYVTSNGKLTGVKAPVGNRMKLGISTDKDKYTLKIDNGYGNYIWFKADKNGIAKYYDEITGKILNNEVKKIVVVKKSDLIGEKPENAELTKKVLEVFDITSHKTVTEDNLKFVVTGGGEIKEFVSKNGKVELELYKNTVYTINIVRTVENTFKMNGFKFKINDDNSIENESKEKVEKLNVYQGSYLVRIYVIQGGKHLTKSIDFKIEEIGSDSVQIRKNENNFLNFDASIGKSYKITMKDTDSEYYLEKPIEFTVEKDAEDGLYWPKVAEGDTSQGKDRKLKAVFLKRYDGVGNDIPGLGGDECPSCPDNSDAVCEVSKTKVKTLPISVNLPEGADKKDIKFKLFNSSKQQYEGEFTLDENGKLPALELFEKNSYFLQLVSLKYSMHNKHFEAVKEGQFPYAFKDKKELKELDVKKKTYNDFNDGTYEIDIKFVKDNKALANEEIQFISATHTTKATTDELGHLKVRLMEDITYVAKPTNENLIIDTFPIVVKDKTEWGVPGIKYVFDHSSCRSAEIIKVKDKLMGKTNGSITCKNGNTTINGMDFKDLSFITDHFDKSDYSELKDKDVMILDFVLLNTVRQNCERTKLAYGEFEIIRKLPANKKVVSVYYLNGDKKEEFKFEQSGALLKVKDVHSLGIYPLVIEFEKTGLDFPDNPGQHNPGQNNPGENNKDEEITLIHEQTKISVKGLKSVLESLKLKVNDVDSSKFDSLKNKNAKIYDIEFLDNSENLKKVENGKYIVTIPKKANSEVIEVYYVEDSGKLNSLEFTQDDKNVHFETTHFSKYALVYKTEKKEDKKQNVNQTKKSKLAKTSIGLNLVTFTALATFSLSGIYISKKKNDK